MRIIDKNSDFYDYIQNVYRDPTFTFDRTDSFIVTKELMCSHLYTYKKMWWDADYLPDYDFVLLQICNTFWLFLVEITKINYPYHEPLDYTVELLTTWKNYSRQRELIRFDVISFNASVITTSRRDELFGAWRQDENKIKKQISNIVNAINTNNYKIYSSVDKCTIYHGDGKKVEKHIPLLKASGFIKDLDPLEVYLSFEEYFSLEKTSSKRIYSTDITDAEKIENHGFDLKTSFRGK